MVSNNLLIEQEYEKCKNSPYYFATNYIKLKNEKGELLNFTTNFTEEEFNKNFK